MRILQAPIGLMMASVLLACGATAHEPASNLDPQGGEWVDLTYQFDDQTLYWPTAEPFHLEEVSHGYTPSGYFYAANNYGGAEHGGTHLDAPVHFSEGGWSTEEIPIDRLMGPAVVVDVSAQAAQDPDYQVSIGDLEAWEAGNNPIPEGAIVFLRTGWGDRWPDAALYLGTDRTGPEAVAELHFPGLSPEAAAWLVSQRRIDAVGIDTASIDYGQSTTFQTHVTLFGANVPAFENVANLGWLPATGAFAIALPMKIAGGSGGPTRIVALLPSGR